MNMETIFYIVIVMMAIAATLIVTILFFPMINSHREYWRKHFKRSFDYLEKGAQTAEAFRELLAIEKELYEALDRWYNTKYED